MQEEFKKWLVNNKNTRYTNQALIDLFSTLQYKGNIIQAAHYLSNLIFWSGKGSETEPGTFYKNKNELMRETGMSRRTSYRLERFMINNNLISKKIKYIRKKRKVVYKVHFIVLNFAVPILKK